METHLFGSIIFGPVRSRRLGLSLGINLLPANKKICTFDCVYCECGWTDKYSQEGLPKSELVIAELEKTSGNATCKRIARCNNLCREW